VRKSPPFVSLASIETTFTIKAQHGSIGEYSLDCHPGGHQEQQHAADTNRGGKFKKKKKEKGKIPTSSTSQHSTYQTRRSQKQDFWPQTRDIKYGRINIL